MKNDWESYKSCKSELEIIEKSAQQGKTIITTFISMYVIIMVQKLFFMTNRILI